MSRIGRQPIAIPAGVGVLIDGQRVEVSGPRGTLRHTVARPITAVVNDGAVVVSRPNDEQKNRALHGLTRTLIANMVRGVTDGFSKTLEITGTGYRASKQGNKLVISIGYSQPVEMEEPEGITIEVNSPTVITVRGNDKQAVGQTAAEIRAVRRPEPYLGKGIHYQGERIRRKQGKTGK